MKNKITIAVLSATLITFLSIGIPRAEAQFGNFLGDLLGGFMGGGNTQNVRIIGDASESSLTTAIKSTLSALTGQKTADALEQLLFKEQVLDPAAWGMAKQMQQQLTAELLKWLGGQQPGQNGEVPFVQNLGEHYQQISNDIEGQFIFGDRLTGRCSEEEDFRVRQEVFKRAVEQRKEREGQLFQCYQEGESSEQKNSLTSLFRQIASCDGNEICAVYKAEQRLAQVRLNTIENEETVLNWGRGMRAQRVCQTVTDEGGRNSRRCQIVNPPSLAADMVSFNLVEMPGLQLLNMDEFNEIASNLMNNLANQALQGLTGVLGLSGNPTYSQNIFGAEGNLSYVDALIQDNITQYQTGGANAIKNSLAAEREYFSLLQFIRNQINALEKRLDENRQEFPGCFDLELTSELSQAKSDNDINLNVSSTTLSILSVLDQQYDQATDAATRNGVLSTYAEYRSQGFFRTDYQNEELKITYIDMDFAQMVEKFKYDTSVERQSCGGNFDYEGVLTQ